MADEKDSVVFDISGNNVTLPSSSLVKHGDSDVKPNGIELQSKGIESAICGNIVKSIIIPEDYDMIPVNYVLDFTMAKELRMHQVKSLDCLINPDGDTAIYVNLPNGLEKLGMGMSTVLDKVLVVGISSVFGDQCKVYKDVQKGQTPRMVSGKDLKKIRLNI